MCSPFYRSIIGSLYLVWKEDNDCEVQDVIQHMTAVIMFDLYFKSVCDSIALQSYYNPDYIKIERAHLVLQTPPHPQPPRTSAKRPSDDWYARVAI